MQPDSLPSRTTQAMYSLLLVVALCVTCFSGSRAVGQDQARLGGRVIDGSLPPERQGVDVKQNLGDEVPGNLEMLDSEGQLFLSGQLFDGKTPTIITLNYSNCPVLCSTQLNRLVLALNDLELKVGQDFKLLTLSIDPKESTERSASTKARYVDAVRNQPGTADGWTFATAKQPVITKMADALGFQYKYDPVIKQYNHPAMLAFVSPDGVITRYSLSLDFPSDQLKLALVEAGEGTVGNVVDQFILWCYSYDATSNSYTPVAWRIMRLGGLGFLCVLLIVLTPYWLGTRGKTKPAKESCAQKQTSLLASGDS